MVAPPQLNLVRAGEASGTLAEILERLAHHYESVGEIREKVVSALIYPLIIIGVGVVTIIFFMTVMVPKFADMFRDMGRTMPLPTRMLIGISDLVVGYWWIPVILMVVGVVLLRQRMASVDGRLQLDGWTLRMPSRVPAVPRRAAGVLLAVAGASAGGSGAWYW